ncbi:hypothetical protein B0T11DRAFT_67329 [Plectosphaerella cucumerina]|uniref:Chondroitin AC/alginate lyase n=1 Tax=Plectosphaerella cucumerina TaxID=40658 RepID=A0A8K0TKA5_9PEZI|nr:hypothetical protein B0T11DRAFT_67329 [Plectosphaerella cucumerina]
MRLHFLTLAASLPLVLAGVNYKLVAKPECNETISGGFRHPGIFHTCEDLVRMQTKVWAGEEPWTTAFGRAFNQSLVGLDVPNVGAYHIRGPLPALPFGEDAWSSNFTVDAQYAYLNTVAYFVTGHPFHRQRALHAVRRWLTTLDLLEEYIRGGAGLRYLTAACEILRSTKSSVWTDADTKLYHDFAARVRANWDSTNGMARPDLFFNQGAYANGGAMAMAVFIEDADLFRQMVFQATVGANPLPHIDYSIRRMISNDSKAYGQITEMGRDQVHPAGTLKIFADMAYTADIQGDLEGRIEYVDMFSFDDYRLLAGFEYFARYNLGHDVPWQERWINEPAGKIYDRVANTSDRGMPFRTMQHPTDSGALWSPTAAYYRFRELVPDRLRYLTTYIETQTLGLDTLIYAKEGNFEDLNFSRDAGYGAAYLDVISGEASRRLSEDGETVEGRARNGTAPDIAVIESNATLAYPLFWNVLQKPVIRLEALSANGVDLVVRNMSAVVAEYRVPAGEKFETVFVNTTLGASSGRQFLYLDVSGQVDIARFGLVGADEVEVPFE